ncbi:protein translocase subunit SecF [Arcobacter porcinus]|uniref:Protein-export membrane protein SecF n=1 Tax=Arcobacter porcinus TaxID=1935204 RepID=A0A5C2HKN9_9BACT|nr:protein translocase subunit SecF [Arcobacter porcinus]OCL83513.1 preprotein translocase subunit SecF [Arcobacter porcinus]OCL87989.1 preprotein translocase subunit SecF [Arcobacter porcinus]OCL94351.1 preprotein translocase subunit SecF [Aliarcobacter thereius]QEP41300.1 protein-export membrane protein SecF [Arcobacter porcinus]
MEIFSNNKTYDFMGKKIPFLGLSGVLIIASLVLLFTKGLNYGIDFVGGTVVQVKYDKEAPIDHIREVLQSTNYANSTVTEFGSKEEITIRFTGSTSDITNDISDEMHKILDPTGNFEIRKIDMVGAKVGGELRVKGVTALALALLAMLIYITYRFEWKFAVASIIGLVHDVIISLGFISLFSIDVNLDMIAAILTLIGYTINDTIIVNDRIRETLHTSKQTDLDALINESVSRTLSRTVLTSSTTWFVVVTMLLFGGEIIYAFTFTLFVGIIIGTYSSIFVVSPFIKFLGFNINDYRSKEQQKEIAKKEKEKLRSMYEQGRV